MKLKVKHLFLISAVGMLTLLTLKLLFSVFGVLDMLYLIFYMILLTLSYRPLLKYRNMEYTEYAEVSKKWE